MPSEVLVQETDVAEAHHKCHIPSSSLGTRVHFTMAFLGLSVLAFTSALDVTILPNALPIIATDLHLTSLESFWAGICFLLSGVVFQPVTTAFSDVFGRKPILYCCMAFFSLGSLIVGVSNNAATLIAGRTIQGVGGGGMGAMSEIILTDITTLRERPKYLGLLGIVWGAGSVMGPLLGGIFAEYSSWRWIAWINLPLIGTAVPLVVFFLTLATDDSNFQGKLKRVDWIGIVILFVALTLIVVPVTWAGQLYKWQDPQTILLLVLGAMLLLIFFFYEKYPVEPVFKPTLFVLRTSGMNFIGAFIHGIILWAVVFYLSLYFQSVTLRQPMQAAILTLPLIATVSPMAIISALTVEWSRRYNWLNRLAWAMLTIGLGVMMLMGEETPMSTYIGLQIPVGLGAGILFTGLTVGMQASMSAEDVGVATGIFVVIRDLGAVFGLAVGSSIFGSQFDKHIRGIELPSSFPALHSGTAVEFIPRLRGLDVTEDLRSKILGVYAASFRTIWLVMACLSAIGLVSSMLTRELTIEREDLGNQAFMPRVETKESRIEK